MKEQNISGKEKFSQAAKELTDLAWQDGFERGSEAPASIEVFYRAVQKWYKDEVLDEHDYSKEPMAENMAYRALYEFPLTSQIIFSYLWTVKGTSDLDFSAMERSEIERFCTEFDSDLNEELKKQIISEYEDRQFPPELPPLEKLIEKYS